MNGSIREPIALGPSRRLLLVALGGALGAALRYLVTVALPEAASEHASAADGLAAAGLLAVNLSGALVAGFLRGVLEQEQARGRRVEGVEAFFIVGLCGGYTSYSAFVATAVGDWGASPVFAASIALATLVFAPLAALGGMRLSGGYPARPEGSQR
jgi:CrcB protein